MSSAPDLSRDVEIDFADLPPLYHGGRPNLKPGSYLLPPTVTGEVAGARPDRVYVTVDLDAARFFAAMNVRRPRLPGVTDPRVGAGTVYLVRPDTTLEHDESFDELGYSYQARSFRVLEVVERHVQFPEGIDPAALAGQIDRRGGVTVGQIAGMGARTIARGRAPR